MARITIPHLMQPQPPQFIDPLRLARQGAEISGRIPVAELARLCEAIADRDGDVEYVLEFGRDAGGIHCIMGSLVVRLNLTCQRCLRPMPVRLEGRVCLGIVQGEVEARQLPPQYEPLPAPAQQLRLAQLLEDEALLLLPFAPLHDSRQCTAGSPESVAQSGPVAAETHKPFAGLRRLKRQQE